MSLFNKKESKLSNYLDGYKIYSKDPLLKITLTPDMIKEIRKYNKGYNDFKK